MTAKRGMPLDPTVNEQIDARGQSDTASARLSHPVARRAQHQARLERQERPEHQSEQREDETQQRNAAQHDKAAQQDALADLALLAASTPGTARRQLLVVPPLAVEEQETVRPARSRALIEGPTASQRAAVADDPEPADEQPKSARESPRAAAANDVPDLAQSTSQLAASRSSASTALLDNQQTGPSQPTQCVSVQLGVLIGLLAALLISVVMQLIGGQPTPRPEPLPVLTSVSKICQAPVDGSSGELFAATSGQQSSAAQVAVTPISDGTRRELQGFPAQLTQTSLLTPLAASTVHGGVLSQAGAQTFWANCRTPGTDLYLQAPSTEGARLLLVNPDDTTALVDLTITTPDGDVTPANLRGLNLAGRGSLSISLADVATSNDAVGVRVRVTSGRVYAGLQISNSSGGDFARASQGGREVLIATVPPGSQKVHLLVSNPGTTRLTVRISAYGAAGKYELPGLPEITVDQRRTQRFDLSAAVTGDQISLQLTAEQDFAASVISQVGSDFAIVAGQADGRFLRATELFSVLPPTGTVMLANLSAQDNAVSIDWGAGQATAQRVLAPGATTQLAIPASAQLVRVEAQRPITGGVVIKQADGIAVAPLEVGAPTRTVQLVPDPHIG